MMKTMTAGKFFSIASSAYTLIFLIINNIMHTSYPWVLFCVPAFVIWPIAVCMPRQMTTVPFAFLLSIAVVGYYALLNLFLAPGYPWILFVIFAVAWYPFSVLLAKRTFAYSVFGLIWSILFFSIVNIITSPHTIWAVYPVFAVLWWPLSVYFFVERPRRQRVKNL